MKAMRGAAVAMLVSSSVVACGDENSPSGDAGPDKSEPLYALATFVFDDTNTSTYLTLLDSLGEQEDIDLSKAREFPGWANPGAFGGHLFISSSEAPELTRYSVSSSGTLEGGETVSFANFTSDSAPMFANFFIDEDTALITLDQTTRVLWDPDALAIRGEATSPPVDLTRDGMSVASYAYRDAVRPDGVFQSYYWNEDNYAFHPTSQIAVYDREDASLKKLIDAPCPALYFASADEEGNLYFSSLGDIIAYQLLDESAPESCAVRVNAGETAIADGWPRSFAELTGGRPTGELSYLKDGFGILRVYHNERATIGPATEATELVVADNWRLWLVDLEAWTAEPIEGLDWLAGGTHLSTVDGRAFLFASSSDFSTTTVYEISADGQAAPLFEIPGYAEKFVKVR
jgi:hypothetical protein